MSAECRSAIGTVVGGHRLVALARDDRDRWAWVCRDGEDEHAGFGALTVHGAHRNWADHVRIFTYAARGEGDGDG